MNEEVQETNETNESEGPVTPFEFLKQFKGAPDENKINEMKHSAPGNRLRMFTSSDGKKVYVLRGISAFELEQLQNGILKTILPEKYPAALKNSLAAKCVVWTNATPTGRISEVEFKSLGAGLVDTLHEVISELSDYMESPQIRQFSADL
jgi:hypothetical protein